MESGLVGLSISPQLRLRPGWLLTLALALLLLAAGPGAVQARDIDHSAAEHKPATANTKLVRSAAKKKKNKKPSSRASRAARAARLAVLHRAFVASSDLRPMAQQLAATRSAAAYSGVSAYAHRNTGEAAAAAYLALGHAYLIDKRYADAEANLKLARQAGRELSDYADFLGARAYHESGNESGAEALLRGFAERYPESIFSADSPVLEANVLLAMGNADEARKVLTGASGTDAATRPRFELAEGEVEAALGEPEKAERIYKELLLSHPLSGEAEVARGKLIAMGAQSRLTIAELRSLGDAFYNGGRYEQASEEFRTLAKQPGIDPAARNGFAVAAAACDLKLKRLTREQVEALAASPDENGARRMYLLMELARNREDLSEQQRLVAEMERSFPQSPWLAEALFSSGNMYLLRKEYGQAVVYYRYLAEHFPSNPRAPAAHWRAGWLSYRQGMMPEAAQLFDEQIRLFPLSPETVSALYWRGRLYESEKGRTDMAAAHYQAVVRGFQHYFYAQMARRRLAALGNVEPAHLSHLDRFQPQPVPRLDGVYPEDSPHLAKARLVANAGLNEYLAQEIAADPDSSSWSALAEAQIYASYGETFRALRAVKRALPYANSAPIQAIPLPYWRILYPQPWWDTITSESAKNNLDPYLVASLIRQESEFNPAAISHANAYGLMQLLPSVGKRLAREEGMAHFETLQLLDPITNIRLGTRYLRQTLDRFGGETEYALAAYDAGDDRVQDWRAAGTYQGIDDFVESIPFTETREYVQAILRNRETYSAIDALAGAATGPVIGAVH